MGVFWASPERIEVEFDAARRALRAAAVSGTSLSRSTELADGGIRLTLNVSNDWALRSWVLSFGIRRARRFTEVARRHAAR